MLQLLACLFPVHDDSLEGLTPHWATPPFLPLVFSCHLPRPAVWNSALTSVQYESAGGILILSPFIGHTLVNF